MIMLVLISNVVGMLLREWRQCRRVTRRTIGVALAVLIAAVLLLTYGNYVGESATTTCETPSSRIIPSPAIARVGEEAGSTWTVLAYVR
jgi:hypothetical protein